MGRPLLSFFVSKFAKKFSIKENKINKILILFITFCIYMTYHLSRRSLSVVKPVLNHKNCSDLPESEVVARSNNVTDENWCDWEPFKGQHTRSLLGTLDLVFLISYSVSMYINGMIAERMNLRYFLTIGMILAGITNCLFGMAFYLNIHALGYFYAIQVLTGIAQSTGWPGVLATVANWFGPSKRGLIFGIWNAHVNVGNIAGAAIAGYFVNQHWGLSFIVPGIIIAAMGLVVFLILVPKPVVNSSTKKNEEQIEVQNMANNLQQHNQFETVSHTEAIGIIDALKIPGVIEFSICLFFAKLVSYTFLDWLPYYISQTNVQHLSSSQSAYSTIMFDVGGIIGGITAGFSADRSGASGLICIIMLICAIPSLGFYRLWGNKSSASNMGLQFLAGIFVNAPYALITTAVSAELGSKVPSKSALATVSGIIDATGSFGSAIGPTLSGYLSEFGWSYVFIMVMVSDFLALLSLSRIGFKDIRKLLLNRSTRKQTTISTADTNITRF